jgi:hypothetical protein
MGCLEVLFVSLISKCSINSSLDDLKRTCACMILVKRMSSLHTAVHSFFSIQFI